MSILVTGGARSGKSSFAEKLCMSRASSAVYIATAQAFDDEMGERIAQHRLQREQAQYNWQTIEEPLEIASQLNRLGENEDEAPAVLVDCLTLWLSNVILLYEQLPNLDSKVKTRIEQLTCSIASYPGQLILVTNEVGDGIVPEYPLGRIYRDFAGWMNQEAARVSSEVYLVTAGIPIELKSREYKL
ncbi:bifunctional adenosylcobinamide kinase/adenosylcobinamide-phosphate guanylyltransferase [Paenibacillus sediminis]|uniref:Adenosylcobinamide kinase n=1 Tax=Paenibacillus sediminis TaxID=664909 RepID=A0ABS4H5D6_9BACL|nr:bifunctional adenosylcobinamide kinase/adenosylcobinamide-phosphate guanylyltransferase [Paenibacillus sediminis]MBP1937462.1 adenosylcobinamide kinase/adenosylcobinamide-phosphate guanylyltransferase [Paenibacillus sediminis]